MTARARHLLVLLMVAVIWLAASLSGCASAPPPAPTKSLLAECMETVAGSTINVHDRLRAAEWCARNYK